MSAASNHAVTKGCDVKVTALDHLKAGELSAALDLLEHIRATVEVKYGEPVPFDSMPIMPLTEPIDSFVEAWARAFDGADHEQRQRIGSLRPWLADACVLPVGFMEYERSREENEALRRDLEAARSVAEKAAEEVAIRGRRLAECEKVKDEALAQLRRAREKIEAWGEAAACAVEWRPVTVLNLGVVQRHRRWMVREANGEALLYDMKTQWDLCRENPIYLELQRPGWFLCRPIDAEAMPVPWAEVGL